MHDRFDEPLDWGQVIKRLTAFAHVRLERVGRASPEVAEDLASEAIHKLFDDAAAPTTPTVATLKELGSMVNGLIANLLRSKPVNRTHSLSRHPGLLDARAERRASLEDVLARDEHRAQLINSLRERLSEDAELLELLELRLEGVDQPREQASILSVPIHVIYNANRRLQRHFVALREANTQEDHSR